MGREGEGSRERGEGAPAWIFVGCLLALAAADGCMLDQ